MTTVNAYSSANPYAAGKSPNGKNANSEESNIFQWPKIKSEMPKFKLEDLMPKNEDETMLDLNG